MTLAEQARERSGRRTRGCAMLPVIEAHGAVAVREALDDPDVSARGLAEELADQGFQVTRNIIQQHRGSPCRSCGHLLAGDA